MYDVTHFVKGLRKVNEMIVVKKFDDAFHVERFKKNIVSNTNYFKPFLTPSNKGVYAKIIGKNILDIKNVDEMPNRGGPVYLHFYGTIFRLFRKHYLFGFIIPEILYTLFTVFVIFISEEYLFFKIIALFIWMFVYIKSMKAAQDIHQKIDNWFSSR